MSLNLNEAIGIIEQVQEDLSKIPQASGRMYGPPLSETDEYNLIQNYYRLDGVFEFFQGTERYRLQLVAGTSPIEIIDVIAGSSDDDDAYLRAGELLEINHKDIIFQEGNEKSAPCIGDQKSGLYVQTLAIGIAALNLGGLRVFSTDGSSVLFPD